MTETKSASFQQLITDIVDMLSVYVDNPHPSFEEKGQLYLLAKRIGATRLKDRFAEFLSTTTDDYSVLAFLHAQKLEHERLCPICGEPGGQGPEGQHIHCEIDRKRRSRNGAD